MKAGKIQPPFLKKGDEVAIISPSFCIEETIFNEGVRFLEDLGLKVRVGKNALKKAGPFAGSDNERLSDLQEMTDDNKIKAVFCSRGGYGLSRIIDKVNFSALVSNPKWFSGFSDVTILHMWLSEVCGIMSIHGEMALNFNNTKKTRETLTSLKSTLFGKRIKYEWEGNIYRPGSATGELTGGNLSLLYSLSGTKAAPQTSHKILFIEDVGENFYHIDRMLTSLRLSGKLANLSALVIGGMNDIGDTKIPWGRNIEETILDIVRDYSYPVFFNFPAGHIADNRALYIGKEAKIEIKGKKAILEYI